MVFVLFHLQKNNSRVGKSACQCESWGQRQTLARPKKAIFPSFVFDQKIIWINWILGISKRNYFHVHASLVNLVKAHLSIDAKVVFAAAIEPRIEYHVK